MISDSDENHYRTDFKPLRDKILRKKPKSKAKARVLRKCDNLIGRAVNRLPWSRLSLIAVEDLPDLKFGKRQNRSRKFRKALEPWLGIRDGKVKCRCTIESRIIETNE